MNPFGPINRAEALCECVHVGNPNTPSEQLGAACSSVIVADDKSNYWAP